MPDVKWMIKAREFVNCNCAYGCPCQFNALPTYGFCQAVTAMEIEQGYHGDTKLDGLRFAGIFRWPGPIHEGHGESAVIIDKRADEAQRDADERAANPRGFFEGASIGLRLHLFTGERRRELTHDAVCSSAAAH